MEKDQLIAAMKGIITKLQADGASLDDLRGLALGLFVSLCRGMLTKEQAHAGLDMCWEIKI